MNGYTPCASIIAKADHFWLLAADGIFGGLGLHPQYGASDRAVAEVLFGIAQPEGRLPFELPSSMEAVRKQYADVPDDSENPLFERGFGLGYRQN